MGGFSPAAHRENVKKTEDRRELYRGDGSTDITPNQADELSQQVYATSANPLLTSKRKRRFQKLRTVLKRICTARGVTDGEAFHGNFAMSAQVGGGAVIPRLATLQGVGGLTSSMP